MKNYQINLKDFHDNPFIVKDVQAIIFQDKDLKSLFHVDVILVEDLSEVVERKSLSQITDNECLVCSYILGGVSHISDVGKIHQFRELLNGLKTKQTNIVGHDWYRLFKHLESIGYDINL